MRCLLTALGSYGDVYPMIALGVAMRDRGHDVTLVTNPHFASDVAEAGLEMLPVSSVERYEELTAERNLWSPTRGLRVVFEQGSIAVLGELYEIVREHHRPGETVVAAHGLDLSSRVAAETLGVPVASIVYAPMALWSNTAPPRMPAGLAWTGGPRWLHRLQFVAAEHLFLKRFVQPRLEAFRRSKGLSPVRGSYWDWYYGTAPPLGLFPDWFVSPEGDTPTDWPAGTVTTGFPLGDGVGGRDQRLDPAVDAFLDVAEAQDDRPIVFTPGSAMRHGERFFDAAIGACQQLGRRGILLTKYDEQLPRRLPPTILAPGFTPLAKLLKRSAAFVHHGGIGSSARGLAAGVPQLIQPMAFDQHDNAWRLRRLGVADELKPSRFTAPRVAEKLEALLGSAETANAAERWSKRVDSGQALRAACEALEQRAVT